MPGSVSRAGAVALVLPGRVAVVMVVASPGVMAAAPRAVGLRPRAWSQRPGRLAVSVAVAVGGRGGRDRARRRGARDRGQAGGGDEEVLDALAGHLASAVASEGVQQVAVVGDLLAVGVVDHGELAGCSAGGWRG